MNYSVSSIAKIISANVTGNSLVDFNSPILLTDSRSAAFPSQVLFFALKGERHNGHLYINDLYKRGVRAFVVSEDVNAPNFPEAIFLRVLDTLEALQKLAAYHRDQFHIPVIGITGSNGKTIVKEWLFQLMHVDKKIVRSPKSFNSQLGVPLSVWEMNESHQLAIFEAGISRIGEMMRLEKIIKPTMGIITNLLSAHQEGFDSYEAKVEEKLRLFKSVDCLIYCSDQSLIDSAVKHMGVKQLFSWSKRNKEADLYILSINTKGDRAIITGVYKGNAISITLPFTDEASIENAIHCWLFMLLFGYSPELIAERMLLLTGVAMRLEIKEGVNNCTIINDAYNSDMGSLSVALDLLNQQNQHSKKSIILSDILQSGEEEPVLYKQVFDLIAQKGVQRVWGVGPVISKHAHLFNGTINCFNSTEAFIQNFNIADFSNEAILIKGARKFEFEKISSILQQKAHETVLEVNLSALVHNLNYYRSKLSPGTKLMAMVKAFSYGSGSFEIANVLQHQRIDYLAVAYADEGVELRKAGITLPIMVMSPEEQGYEAMINYDLEPEIFNVRVWNAFESTLKRIAPEKQMNVHIKLDTGMHRLGFEVAQLPDFLKVINKTSSLKIRSVFSHLAASDDVKQDAFTHKQLTALNSMCNEIEKACGYEFLKHIANSAAIARFPEAQLNMVRLGIGLYGVGVDEVEQQKLQTVQTLKTTISQIKEIAPGDSVGYSRKAIVSKSTTIATLPIGYADGFSRRLSNGVGKVWINGKLAPVIGNVCMDMCMVDITGIQAKEGDEVQVFGPNYTVHQLAESMQTIPYEALTMISRRVKRVYIQD